VAVRQAALVSDESALEACLRRCAIQIDDFFSLGPTVFREKFGQILQASLRNSAAYHSKII